MVKLRQRLLTVGVTAVLLLILGFPLGLILSFGASAAVGGTFVRAFLILVQPLVLVLVMHLCLSAPHSESDLGRSALTCPPGWNQFQSPGKPS